MRLNGLLFQPALLPSLATLLLLALLLWLGFWQLDRAQQKQALQTAFATQLAQPYVPLNTVAAADPTSRYRRVEVSGHFDDQHQILLDNQINNGQVGYHVYLPLLPTNSGPAVLVNYGWVAMDAARRPLLDQAIPQESVTIRGRLAQPANPGLLLANPIAAEVQWPLAVQHVDYAELAKVLGYPLLPAVVLLDPQSVFGYRRAWQPDFGGFGPERHHGYAVQWFTLAAVLLVLYIAANTRRSD